jgi:hypothetical protein
MARSTAMRNIWLSQSTCGGLGAPANEWVLMGAGPEQDVAHFSPQARMFTQRRLVLQFGGVLAGGDMDSHLGRVFLLVIHQGNGIVFSFYAVYGHSHPGLRGGRLQNPDVIHRLPITVVYLEFLPIYREAGRETEFVHFQPIGELEGNVDRGAGIQRGAHLAGKPRPSHGRWIPQRAVAPQELRPVGADGPIPAERNIRTDLPMGQPPPNSGPVLKLALSAGTN